ncbi:outer membrane lipoprotein carrier protein LolA, partial [Acidobacteria bacterium AH-259-G07]|nr:outer membrane lipoprotein carrier protein LolA [Acidobacteria bacterium AH-259-G07]
ETPDEMIVKLQKKYEQIQSFSAEFDQMFRGHNVQLRESGIVMMKKPGKMYWEYRQPMRKLFIADGKKSYFYVPRDKQVIVSDLELNSAPTPLLFLVGKGNIKEDFEVELEQEENPLQAGNLLIRLTTKRPQGEFSHVILEFNPSSYLIQRLIVIEPIGNRNEYILTNLRENIRIPDRQFRFKVPAGAEVLHQ